MASAALTGLYLWKGKNLRSQLSMTGDGWNNLDPEVKQRAEYILHDANKAFKPVGLSVGIFEGWRTIERQLEVINKGSSFVDNALRSYHPWGLAVDFVFINRIGGWTWEPFPKNECAWYDVFCTDPNREAWNTLGGIIKSHGMEWGGDWDNFDGPHAQYTGYGRSTNLISEFKEPDNFIFRNA